VPDQDILKAWAAQHGYGSKTFQELCKMEEVKKHMLAVVTQHGKLHDLKGFENVKNIYLEPEPFTLENDMLTPTFKLKRFEASKRYKKQIDALYAEINSASA
jgi:long-chain acyl-CoA synthetase